MIEQPGNASGTMIKINGKEIYVQYPVVKTVEVGEKTIALFDLYDLPSEHPFKGRNVVAYDANGKEVWRIQAFWHHVRSHDGNREIPDAYAGIRRGENGKLLAFQGIGYTCEIDPDTGQIIGEEHTR